MAENDRNLGDSPQRSVRAALAAGVPIAMGTDAGVPFVRRGDNAIELVLMVEAGLSPMQSIVASTRNAALALGLQNEIGTIEVGKCADLLVIEYQSFDLKPSYLNQFLKRCEVAHHPLFH